jgi:hypothetical protein
MYANVGRYRPGNVAVDIRPEALEPSLVGGVRMTVAISYPHSILQLKRYTCRLYMIERQQ